MKDANSAGVAGTFVLDRADAAWLPAVERAGLGAVVADKLVHRGADPGPPLDAILLTAPGSP